MDLSRKVRLSAAEAAVFSLRSLYESRGYGRFKVSKFEEYDFYASCKSFLMSENVLTFTDSTGRLMALKPDITLARRARSRRRYTTTSRSSGIPATETVSAR